MKIRELFRASSSFGIRKQTEAAARDPKKVRVSSIVQSISSSGSGGGFEDSPIDFEQISRAYHTDSYIRRAIDRVVGLMFKSGWELKSKNEAASEYVWTRLKFMEESTGLPTDQFLRELGMNYVLYSNAPIVKARAKSSQNLSGVNATGYTGNQPVAGYFAAPPAGFRVSRDEYGNIVEYEQSSGNGQGITFKKEDVIHMTYRKPTGRAYGVPYIHNVLNDVLMLRQIEDNVARLIYRNLFPLQVYQVGLDKPGFEADDEEIELIREELRTVPLDGMLVVPERHNIKAISNQGTALDASNYLKYFRQRVFSGLGMSDSTMGIGDSSNKSTSDNQSADLNDMVKDFQQSFASEIQRGIINELLFEGGFDPTLNADDEVLFIFTEIEQDAKIKKENHLVQLFTQNAITHEELRNEMGLDPVADESRLFFNMVTGALSAQETQSSIESANNSGDNKDQPENQSGKQSSPGQTSRENKKQGLTEEKELVTFSMKKAYEWLSLSDEDLSKKINQYLTDAFRSSYRGKEGVQVRLKARLAEERKDLSSRWIKRVRSDIALSLEKGAHLQKETVLYPYAKRLMTFLQQESSYQLMLGECVTCVEKRKKNYQYKEEEILLEGQWEIPLRAKWKEGK